MNKVILVTGASSGIGLATVKKLASSGHVVFGTARSKADFNVIEQAGGNPLIMEMTDEKTMKTAIDSIINKHGRIDVLFNNAGYGLYGTVEDVPLDAAKHQFEVNLFGLARLTQLVLPYMRKAKSGHIINTSSMGGKVYTPLGAWYHATKYALEGWSDCLRLELKDFNINVSIIEPGGIQTNWGKTAADNLLKYSGRGPYASYAKAASKATLKNYENQGAMTPPSAIADVVHKAIRTKRPKTRYVKGNYARPLMFIRKYLGDRIYDYFMMKNINRHR